MDEKNKHKTAKAQKYKHKVSGTSYGSPPELTTKKNGTKGANESSWR